MNATISKSGPPGWFFPVVGGLLVMGFIFVQEWAAIIECEFRPLVNACGYGQLEPLPIFPVVALVGLVVIAGMFLTGVFYPTKVKKRGRVNGKR